TGIEYDPFISTYEVIEVAKTAAKYGGFYATHSRDERLYVVEAVEEAIEISEKSGAPLEYSHVKLDGSCVWDKVDTVIGLFRDARARGLDVTVDIYPYLAWSTGASFLYGDYTRSQWNNNPELRDAIKAHVMWEIETFFDSDGDLIQIPSYTDAAGNVYVAHTLSQMLAARGVDGTVENLADLFIEIVQLRNPSMIGFGMNEENVQKLIKEDYVSIGSDGSIRSYSNGQHPRNYGTFPQVLGKYVRDLSVLTLDQALYKMTALPAQRLLLEDRGMLKEGYWADITVFDKDKVKDNATFAVAAAPGGIGYVLVNGVVVVDDGAFVAGRLAERPGQVLYGPGYTAN
ncbi:MAG: amidohydrolase family protein, partial [Clostridiales bacterium]|nr:amidohydrolase family protein [Clostridiales bacterium]